MRKLTIKDHVNYKGVSNAKLFDNGSKMVYVVTQMDLSDNKNHKDLYVYDFATKVSRKLTTDRNTGSFLMNDENSILVQRSSKTDSKQTVVNKINLETGEETAYFNITYKVKKLEKVNDNTFVFTTKYDTLLELPEFNINSYENGEPRSKLYDDFYYFNEVKYRSNDNGVINGIRIQLYSFNRLTGETVLISDPACDVQALDINNNQVIYATADTSNPMQVTHQIKKYDLETQTTEILIDSGVYEIRDIYAFECGVMLLGYDTRVTHARENACLYALVDGVVKPIYTDTMDLGRGPGSDSKIVDGDKFLKTADKLYCTLCDDSIQRIASIDIEGDIEYLTEGIDYIGGFELGYDKIIIEHMSDVTLKDLYLYENENMIKLTSHNDDIINSVTISPTEILKFHSNGHDIKGYVIKPIDFDESKKYPAILFIHGGPRGLYGKIYQHRMQVMANRGYFVYYTNPHGSASRGNEFSSIFGKHGEIDYQDLMKFTDEVLAKYPQIDEKRLGVTGHSYGGIMTNWIIGQTNRFAAAVSSASLSNYTTKAGTTDNGLGVSMKVYGDPWENQEWTWNHSPLKYCADVTTPTLFLHSDADYRCFYAEALQMYAGLKRYGVDTEMYLFKNEPHSLKKPRNILKWLEVLVEWFDKYLL